MTQPSPKHRNAGPRHGAVRFLRLLQAWPGRAAVFLSRRGAMSHMSPRRAAIGGVLLAALWLRLQGARYGLPALNDPDEPLFMMTAFDMLRGHTLNPGWFGHPGTTTFYGLMLVMLIVAGAGLATGRFADMDALAGAVYADPSILFLPARLFIICFGIAGVWLTYRLGRRLDGAGGGAGVALAGAALVAANAVHVAGSQIIRTDMMASVFMLLCALCAVSIAERGQRRDYMLAGLFMGLACATKWPAALIAVSVAGAWLLRERDRQRDCQRDCQRDWWSLVCFGLCAVASLFLVSPYLLIDHETLWRNLSAEARPHHPGASGEGFWRNLLWYGEHPLRSSFGVAGLALALIGLFVPLRRGRIWLAVILPFCLVYLAVLSAQSLRWERWTVPLVPFLALAAARALGALAGWLTGWSAGRGRAWARGGALALMLALVLAPMLGAVQRQAREKRHDSRQIASAWLHRHVPAGNSIVIEHAGFDLLRGPWPLRFPLGKAGCVDVRGVLSGTIRYAKVEEERAGGAIVDIGHVPPARLGSCRADYAVISQYQRYQDEAWRYPTEMAAYRRLLAGAKPLVEIRPQPGRGSGPVVRIYRLAP